MKQTYFQPEMDVISLNLKQGILFGSDNGAGVLNGGGDLGDFNPANPLDSREMFGMPVNIFE